MMQWIIIIHSIPHWMSLSMSIFLYKNNHVEYLVGIIPFTDENFMKMEKSCISFDSKWFTTQSAMCCYHTHNDILETNTHMHTNPKKMNYSLSDVFKLEIFPSFQLSARLCRVIWNNGINCINILSADKLKFTYSLNCGNWYWSWNTEK